MITTKTAEIRRLRGAESVMSQCCKSEFYVSVILILLSPLHGTMIYTLELRYYRQINNKYSIVLDSEHL